MPPKKRDHGSGSIHQRADGLWIGQVRAGYTEAGKYRRLTVSAKTQAECKKKLERLRAQVARDEAPTAGRLNVKAWSDAWLARTVHEVRPTTFTDYQSNVYKWIVPTIGDRKLEMLTPADIYKVSDAVRAPDLKMKRKDGTLVYPNGRASSTARHVHIVLIDMLRAAMADGHPVPPRVLMVKAPVAGTSDRTDVPAADAIRILAAASAHPDGSRWAAALLQGIRQGEALGLTWDHVDLDGGTMDISWQLQDLPYRHGCGAPQNRTYPCGKRFGGHCALRQFRVPDGYESRQLEGTWHLVRPKTAKGQRIIPMVPWLTAALAAWKQVAPVSPHGLVWPRPDGGPRRPSDDVEAWKQLQVAAGTAHPTGREWKLHEARHTTATLLLDAGIDPMTVTAILGHSNIVTSRGYMHVSQVLARNAMDAVAARLQIGG